LTISASVENAYHYQSTAFQTTSLLDKLDQEHFRKCRMIHL